MVGTMGSALKEEDPMGLRINSNIAALNAHHNLKVNDDSLYKVLEKLSTGSRINHSADDAAGMAISEKISSQVKGLNLAARNAQDGVSMLQTTEGALSQTQNILQRMRTIAVQGANDTLTPFDRSNLMSEMNQLSSEIDRIANNTDFNTKKLLDGSLATVGFTVQIGANTGQSMTITIGTATASALTVDAANISLDTPGIASDTIAILDDALNAVSSSRSDLGAAINRLTTTMETLGVQSENLVAARSRITDLDMAAEVVELSRNQILQQASTAMLTQANQAPQAVLSLLKN